MMFFLLRLLIVRIVATTDSKMLKLRVGKTPSFEEATTCGIQSYAGQTQYKFICTEARGMYVIIRKNDDSPYLHINHVTVEGQAFLSVFEASSVLHDDEDKWGPAQALTEISPNGINLWHSKEEDINPSITFKLQQEYDVLSVEV